MKEKKFKKESKLKAFIEKHQLRHFWINNNYYLFIR